jgi:hypothetical protein
MYHWLIYGERRDKTPAVGFVHSTDPLLYFLFFFVGTEEGNSAALMTDMGLVGHDGGSTGSCVMTVIPATITSTKSSSSS